jgi:hypothetical protein
MQRSAVFGVPATEKQIRFAVAIVVVVCHHVVIARADFVVDDGMRRKKRPARWLARNAVR